MWCSATGQRPAGCPAEGVSHDATVEDVVEDLHGAPTEEAIGAKMTASAALPTEGHNTSSSATLSSTQFHALLAQAAEQYDQLRAENAQLRQQLGERGGAVDVIDTRGCQAEVRQASFRPRRRSTSSEAGSITHERRIPTSKPRRRSVGSTEISVACSSRKHTDDAAHYATASGDVSSPRSGHSSSNEASDSSTVAVISPITPSKVSGNRRTFFPSWYYPGLGDRGEEGVRIARWISLEEERSMPPPPDRCILSPVGYFRLCWDAVWCFVLLYEIWMTPFSLIYVPDSSNIPEEIAALSVVSVCFFFADIVLNFFTGYVNVKESQLVMQRLPIVFHYLRGGFWFDLLVTVPWDEVVAGGDAFSTLRAAKAAKMSKATKVLKLFKMVRLFRILRHAKTIDYMRTKRAIDRLKQTQRPKASRFKFIWDKLEVLNFTVRPLQGLALLLFHAHIYSCLFGAMQPDWASSDDVQDGLAKYYRGFCWSYASLIFGGVPISDNPSIWILELVLFSERLLLSAAGIGFLVFEVLIWKEHDAQTAVKTQGALEFVKAHGVSTELQRQILTTVKATGKLQRLKLNFSSVMDDGLPVELQRRIREEMWVPKLLSLGLIMRVASWDDRMVAELAQVVREELYAPMVIVFQAGESASAAYLVLSGKVAVFVSHEADDQNVPPFTDGMWISEKSLVGVGLRRSGLARTRTMTTLLVVPTQGFMELLRTFDLKKRFDDLCARELTRGLCGRCGLMGDHFSDECPLITGAGHMSTWANFVRTCKGGKKKERRLSRDLRAYLEDKNLERIRTQLAHMDITHLHDLLKLDVEALDDRLRRAGQCELSEVERAWLQAEEIDSFLSSCSILVPQNVEMLRSSTVAQDCCNVLYLSHYKPEAGMQAVMIQSELEVILREDFGRAEESSSVFVDSDNFCTLEHLRQQVRNSQCVALLLTAKVLEQPWVLVELVTAVRHGVHVIPIELQEDGKNTFQPPSQAFFDSIMDCSLLGGPGTEVLRSNRIEPSDVVEALQVVFKQTAVPFSPRRSKNIRRAELLHLLRQCSLSQMSKPVGGVKALPPLANTGSAEANTSAASPKSSPASDGRAEADASAESRKSS